MPNSDRDRTVSLVTMLMSTACCFFILMSLTSSASLPEDQGHQLIAPSGEDTNATVPEKDDSDDCSDVCKNGGTFVLNETSWSCICQPSYFGRQCERLKCQNGGTELHLEDGSVICVCPFGFHGYACELEYEKQPPLCYNGGTTGQYGSFFYCTCSDGFTGDRCQYSRKNDSYIFLVGYKRYDSFFQSMTIISLPYTNTINIFSPNPPFVIGDYGTTVVFDNELYVTGAGGSNNELWKWSKIDNTWSKQANLPTAVRYHCAVAASRMIYILGGQPGTAAPVTSIYSYNPETNTWVADGVLSLAVSHHACVVHRDEYIYVFGGSTSPTAPTNVNQRYSTFTKTTERMGTTLPRALTYLRGALFENSIILLHSTTALIYNIESRLVTERAQFAAGTDFFAVVIYNSIVYQVSDATYSDVIRTVPARDVINDKPALWQIHGRLAEKAQIIANSFAVAAM